ncbi:MAG: TetR/AcrR family transcriptional regulator [Actinomycetota bacterium]
MVLTDDAPAPGRSRRNRGSDVVRNALVDAGIAAFAAYGFDGASTRVIADAAAAHQSQIKYHFASKADLWKRCMERLLGELDDAIAIALVDVMSRARGSASEVEVMEATIRGLVSLAAQRPELNRIMMHEATSPGERLQWLVETHLGPRQVALASTWQSLLRRGIAAPIEADAVYHTLIGAASLLYANAPEAELMGLDPQALVERHADALVAVFLPGR